MASEIVAGVTQLELSIESRILEQFLNWEDWIGEITKFDTAICCAQWHKFHLILILCPYQPFDHYSLCLVCLPRSGDKCKSWSSRIALVSSLQLLVSVLSKVEDQVIRLHDRSQALNDAAYAPETRLQEMLLCVSEQTMAKSINTACASHQTIPASGCLQVQSKVCGFQDVMLVGVDQIINHSFATLLDSIWA